MKKIIMICCALFLLTGCNYLTSDGRKYHKTVNLLTGGKIKYWDEIDYKYPLGYMFKKHHHVYDDYDEDRKHYDFNTEMIYDTQYFLKSDSLIIYYVKKNYTKSDISQIDYVKTDDDNEDCKYKIISLTKDSLILSQKGVLHKFIKSKDQVTAITHDGFKPITGPKYVDGNDSLGGIIKIFIDKLSDKGIKSPTGINVTLILNINEKGEVYDTSVMGLEESPIKYYYYFYMLGRQLKTLKFIPSKETCTGKCIKSNAAVRVKFL